MRIAVFALTFLFSCLFLSFSAPAADKIVADFGGLSGFQSASWVAKDLRLFEKYGLNVDLVMITGGARSVAARRGRADRRRGGGAARPKNGARTADPEHGQTGAWVEGTATSGPVSVPYAAR